MIKWETDEDVRPTERKNEWRMNEDDEMRTDLKMKTKI